MSLMMSVDGRYGNGIVVKIKFYSFLLFSRFVVVVVVDQFDLKHVGCLYLRYSLLLSYFEKICLIEMYVY